VLLSVISEFIVFRWYDALDILLVAILLYQLYKLVRGTVAISILVGIIAVYFLWIIVKAINMQLLSTILGHFIGVGFISLIIVFQQELRRFLLMIGSSGFLNKKKWSTSFLNLGLENRDHGQLDVNAVVRACKAMSENKTGAIIVITIKNDLSFYANTGDVINAKVSLRLIESIFYKNSPLHDGAIIISENYILAARCVLPVSESVNFPANLGMRHRAALGIAETTDAIAIVVSEQTGEIAMAKNEKLMLKLSIEELREKLENEIHK
jgi:diadenylate cyclase